MLWQPSVATPGEIRGSLVLGEGAGMLILEDLEHARARGAPVLAELAGYGAASDASHISKPHSGGQVKAMRMALQDAGLQPEDIGYINAHGTSTPLGDDLELEAVETLFAPVANNIAMSSTKSATGHLLGAAGAIEAIFSVLAIRDGMVPPTLNLDNPSVKTAVDLVPHKAKAKKVDVALSNSFGFGGTNASLIFRRYQH